MSSSSLRKLLLAAGLLLGLSLAITSGTASAAPGTAPEAAPALRLTPRRLAASLASVIGLGGSLCAGWAVTKSRAGRARPGSVATMGMVGVVAGLVSAGLGLVVVLTARGGFGTGQGLAGGIVALALGLLSVALARRAQQQARQGEG